MAESIPYEILCQIFEYLPLSDRLQCSLVSKHFNYSFRNSTPKLHAKTCAIFDSDDQFLRKFSTILAAEHIGGLTLKNISTSFLNWHQSLLQPFFNQLTSLTLVNCSITSRDSFHFLRQTNSLKSLGLVNCRELFISGLPLFKPEEVEELKTALSNVHDLDLSNNQFINDCIFENLIKCLDNVGSIVFDGCKIYCTRYPSEGGSPSPSRLTIRCVQSVIASKSNQIKSLSFKSTSLDVTSVISLGQISGLRLRQLNVSDCTGIGQDAIIDFCKHQPDLEQLNIDFCRRILVDNPERSLTLFQSMWNLSSLSMRCTSMPKGFPDCLAQLDRLKRLDISDADIPDSQVAAAFANSKFKLESLLMVNYTFKPEVMIPVIPRFSDLTELNLNNATCGMTDQVLHEITKHLLKLRKLQMHHCTRLSDLGFAGIQLSEDAIDVSGVCQIARESGKIFPGTRAEAELLDASRKRREVQEKMVTHISFSSSKIDDLNLTFLDVGKVPLTDSTFSTTFAFRELRHVNVDSCKNITDIGFILLAQKNPGLETLIACRTFITDAGLSSVVRHLPRLSHLDVEGCASLTSQGIVNFPTFCQNLRFLNVSFCLKIKTFVVEDVRRKISSLHKVEMRGLHIAECLDEN